jgi:hypothetical protein
LLVPREQEDQSGSYLNKPADKTDYPTLNVSRELSRISAPIAIASRANLLRQFPDRPVNG